MRKRLSKGLALALLVVSGSLALPEGSRAETGTNASSRGAADERSQFTAGEEIARTVTLTTGVPISPLLGVSGLGAWRWWRTPAAARAELPWYARPWFWGPGLFLVFLFAANTTIGAAVPGLKKPMDFVEEHENKFSALVASPIVLLEVKRLLGLGFPAIAGAGVASGAPLAGSGLAFVSSVEPLAGAAKLFVDLGLGILYLACFFLVFIAFHAIQVMIALSPSALLDMLLRGFRLTLLGLLGVTSWIHPYLGATLGFAILFIAWLTAGWSFRLTVYGSILSWEFLTGRDGTADPSSAPLAAFSQRGLKGVKPRSYGRLVRAGVPGSDGSAPWTFRYRPWLVFRARAVPLPAGELTVLQGFLSPLLVRQGALRAQTLVRFPPRFRGREAALATKLGATEVLEGRIVRGFRAAWQWLKDLALGTPESAVRGAP